MFDYLTRNDLYGFRYIAFLVAGFFLIVLISLSYLAFIYISWKLSLFIVGILLSILAGIFQAEFDEFKYNREDKEKIKNRVTPALDCLKKL